MEASRNGKGPFINSSGIPLKAYYSPEDWQASAENLESLGQPGDYPFTRGVQSDMYRGRLWTMRQYAGFGSAKESNARYKHLISQGTTGLSVAFDLPTQMGFDSDHVMATGEVGRVGVAISTLEDMEILLADLPLEKISTSMTINSTAAILLAFYLAVAKKRGTSPKVLKGTIQNDLLKEYIARGTYIFPPRPSLRLITDIFAYCATETPEWNTISISGYHIREAGSTAVQELAFTLANGLTYVQAALDRGLDIDAFGRRLSFFFNSHNNLFEEVAKFRAARRLWANFMRHRFHAQSPAAWKLRFHAQTGGSTLTAQQAENNIVRVAYQALAAVLGGAQSLHTNSMDEALGLPTEKSATIALRTQQILAAESGVPDVVDPLAGSFYIESLTQEIEKRALTYIERIEEMGGVLTAIESGWLQNEIQTAAYRAQIEIDEKKQIIVGVNRYEGGESNTESGLKISPEIEGDQIERLKRFKSRRDPALVQRHLEAVRKAAAGSDNLLPIIVDAVTAKATLGEISDELRKVFGEYRPRIRF